MSDYAVWQIRESRKLAPEVQQVLAPLYPDVRVTASEGGDPAPANLSFTVSCRGASRKLVLPGTVFMERNPAAAILARVRIELVEFSERTPISSKRCLEPSQLEEAIAEARAALTEVEHVTQFQVPDDFPAHLEQLNALRQQIAVYERELKSHLRDCDLCAQ
jgi:hypothetical protein